MIYFLHPWRLLGLGLWLLLLVALMTRQKVSLDWLDVNVAPRFRMAFSRYTRAGLRRHFLFLAITGGLAILAAAGPYRLGRVEREIESHTVLLALDASLSMGAQDAATDPTTGEAFGSRFAAARSFARELVDVLPIDTAFGVYSFSGATVVHTPPTRDRSALALLLGTLTYHVDLTRTGTRYSSLFEALWGTIDPSLVSGYQVVLISDGELPRVDEFGDDLAVFSELGIPVHTVGVGSLEGQARVIYHPDDIRAAVTEKRVVREYHTTRVDETLEAIAERTGGHWQVLENHDSTDELVAAIEKIEPSVVALEGKGREDLSQRPLVVFAVFFLLEALVLSRRSGRSTSTLGSISALVLMVFLVGCEPRIWKAHRTNETGIDVLASGEPKRSEAWFKKSYSLGYREHIPLFNLASAALEQDDPAAAHEIYERTILAKPNLAEAYFNDGHSLFLWAEKEVALGAEACDFDRAVELLAHAASRFETTIDVENRWGSFAAPARENLDFVRSRVQELEELAARCEPPPPPPSGGGGGEDEAEGSPRGESPPLTGDERAEIDEALARIQQESGAVSGFRQSREQQLSPEMLENASGLELWW